MIPKKKSYGRRIGSKGATTFGVACIVGTVGLLVAAAGQASHQQLGKTFFRNSMR